MKVNMLKAYGGISISTLHYLECFLKYIVYIINLCSVLEERIY